MDPISKANRSLPTAPETQISNEKPANQETSHPGISKSPDAIETPKANVLRETYLAGRAASKTLMSDATFNKAIQTMKPSQYPAAFKDLKGWVSSNFALTPDQNLTLSLLHKSQVAKFQEAAGKASSLDRPLLYESHDNDPTAPGPREMKFEDAVVTADNVSIHAKCSPTQLQVPQMLDKLRS